MAALAGSRVTVRLTPRGGRDAIEGWSEDSAGRPLLKARVAAAPADGQANSALVRLLARHLGVAPSSVRLVSGASARIKSLEIEGLDAGDLARRLAAPAP